MEKFDKICPYCGKMMERGEIPRGEDVHLMISSGFLNAKKVNGVRSYYTSFLRKVKIK